MSGRILRGKTWLRHTNPWSVWTRYAAFPVMVAAVWSYHSIGWWSLLPVAVVGIFLAINPRLFAPPASTRGWAAKAVLGERVWAREHFRLPAGLHPQVSYVIFVLSLANVLVLIWAIGRGDLSLTVVSGAGVLILKSWLNDRMVWLFNERARDNPEYADWLY